VKIRLENYDVNGEFCYTRVWAGDGHLTNCGILAFFHEEWFAFMSLFRRTEGAGPVQVEITHLDETRRQLQFDFNPPNPIEPEVLKRREPSKSP
jgi:hypothetical protein